MVLRHRQCCPALWLPGAVPQHTAALLPVWHSSVQAALGPALRGSTNTIPILLPPRLISFLPAAASRKQPEFHISGSLMALWIAPSVPMCARTRERPQMVTGGLPRTWPFVHLSTFFLKTGSRQKINTKPSILQKSRQSCALEAHQGMKSWQDLSLQKLYLSGIYTAPARFHCLTAYPSLLLPFFSHSPVYRHLPSSNAL